SVLGCRSFEGHDRPDMHVVDVVFDVEKRRIERAQPINAHSGSPLTIARHQSPVTPLLPRWLTSRLRQVASSRPSSVDGGALTNGQISSAIRRQSAVAPRPARTAYRPRLIRCRMTNGAGTFARLTTSLLASKKVRTV